MVATSIARTMERTLRATRAATTTLPGWAFDEATALCRNDAERDHLLARRAELDRD